MTLLFTRQAPNSPHLVQNISCYKPSSQIQLLHTWNGRKVGQIHKKMPLTPQQSSVTTFSRVSLSILKTVYVDSQARIAPSIQLIEQRGGNPIPVRITLRCFPQKVS